MIAPTRRILLRAFHRAVVAAFTWATGFRKIPPKSKPCGEDHKVDLFVSSGITHLKPIPDHPLGSQRAGASQIILPPRTLNCRWSLPARGNHLWQRFTTDSLNGESAKRSGKSPARPAGRNQSARHLGAGSLRSAPSKKLRADYRKKF